MLTLSPVECRILHELDKDAHDSFVAIGKRLKVSADSVLYNVTKLQRDGIIERFAPVIDLSRLGLLLFRISGRTGGGSIGKDETTALFKNRALFLIAETRGQHDFICWGSAPNLSRITDCADFVRNQLPNSSGLTVELITETTAYSRGYLTGRAGKIFPARGQAPTIKIDPVELQILDELSKNARTPLTTIAQKLDTTPAIVRYRVEKLERDKVIQGYRLHLNTEKIGLQRFRAQLDAVNQRAIQQLSELSAQSPHITRLERQLGACSAEIGLEIEDFAALHRVLDQLSSESKGSIRIIGTDFFRKTYSANHLPWSELKSKE